MPTMTLKSPKKGNGKSLRLVFRKSAPQQPTTKTLSNAPRLCQARLAEAPVVIMQFNLVKLKV